MSRTRLKKTVLWTLLLLEPARLFAGSSPVKILEMAEEPKFYIDRAVPNKQTGELEIFSDPDPDYLRAPVLAKIMSMRLQKLENPKPFPYRSTGFSLLDSSLFSEIARCGHAAEPDGAAPDMLIEPLSVYSVDLNQDEQPDILTVAKHRHFCAEGGPPYDKWYGYFVLSVFLNQDGKWTPFGAPLFAEPIAYGDVSYEALDYTLEKAQAQITPRFTTLCASIRKQEQDKQSAEGAQSLLSMSLYCWKFQEGKMLKNFVASDLPLLRIRLNEESLEQFMELPQNEGKEPGTGEEWSAKSDWDFTLFKDGTKAFVEGMEGDMEGFVEAQTDLAGPFRQSLESVKTFRKTIALKGF